MKMFEQIQRNENKREVKEILERELERKKEIDEAFYENIKKNLFKEHNKLRTNPQIYIPSLSEALNDFKDKVYQRPNEEPIQTFEGIEAVKEAIQFLKIQKPVSPLTLSNEITNACQDHVNDIGPKGLTTHEGSNGSEISERIEKYCLWEGCCAENLDFGFKNAENIIMNLIIDDGVNGRYQRMNLFNPEFKYIGIGIGAHRDYGICVSIGYSKEIREFDKPPNDVADFIQEYIKVTMNKKNINNDFQENEPFAPDGTISVEIKKTSKRIGGIIRNITKKIFTLNTGAKHIIEILDD